MEPKNPNKPNVAVEQVERVRRSTEECIDVRLEPDPDDIRRTVVGIRVRSKIKDHLKKMVQLDPGNFDRPKDLMAAIALGAAACAEQLGEDAGDSIDPVETYHIALAKATEMFRRHHERLENAKAGKL